MVHRVKAKGPQFDVRIVEWERESPPPPGPLMPGAFVGQPHKLVLEISGAAAALVDESPFPPRAIFRNFDCVLRHKAGRIELTGTTPWNFDQNGRSTTGPFRLNPWQEDKRTMHQRFAEMQFPLMGRSLESELPADRRNYELPADRVRLFLFVPMSDEFFAQSPGLSKQTGYVLYCVDVPLLEGRSIPVVEKNHRDTEEKGDARREEEEK